MTRPAASLSADLVRRPAAPGVEPPVSVPQASRWQEDLRWFLWAWAAGFVAFLIFLA